MRKLGNNEMNDFSYIGRPDGLGNRLEQVILLESICSRLNVNCEYIWQNRHKSRSYKILFKAERVKIVAHKKPSYPVMKFSDFDLSFNQEEILHSARKITATFNYTFPNNISPVGVHIRGTDRIGREDDPQFMKDDNEFRLYLSETINTLNETKPRFVYVCSDSEQSKQVLLRHLVPDIRVVESTCDEHVPPEYADLFALSKCNKIWMVSRFSSFSITAALIGNVPLVTFVDDHEVRNRYKARFEYQELTGCKQITDSLGDQDSPNLSFIRRLARTVRRLINR